MIEGPNIRTVSSFFVVVPLLNENNTLHPKPNSPLCGNKKVFPSVDISRNCWREREGEYRNFLPVTQMIMTKKMNY